MLLFGCVGGGSSQTPPSSAIDIKTEQLYSELATAPNQLYAGQLAVCWMLTIRG